MFIDASIVVLFLVANLWIGLYASRKMTHLAHFSVGHRGYNSFAIFATLTASYIGGGYVLGNAAKVYTAGLIYAFALLGYSLQQIFVAKYVANKLAAYQECCTVGDLMAIRYGKWAKIITGIFSMIICSGILGAQVGALSAVLQTFFNIPLYYGITIGFGIIILYASLGGMRAVIYTDILQFTLLAIGIPLAFIFGLVFVGGWGPISAAVPIEHIHFLSDGKQIILFLSLFVTFFIGEALVPPYVQRLFMSKTSGQSMRATYASGLFSIPFFILAGAIGLIAYTINPELTDNNAFPYVVQVAMPVVIKGLVIAGILSVIMSSAAGYLNAAAVAFVIDVVKPLSSGKFSDRGLLRMAQLGTWVVGIGSVIFALTIENVLSILLYAYQFWAPIILIPLLAMLFKYNVRAKHFYFSAVAGILTVIVWSFFMQNPWGISSVVAGVIASLLVFLVSAIPGVSKSLFYR